MLRLVNQHDSVAAIRLLEFFSRKVPWHRSLWGVGVTLAMDELYEGISVLRQGHLSQGSVTRMSTGLQKRVGQHPGFEAQEKNFLRQLLTQVPRADGPAHYGIRELCERVSSNYLQRWAGVVSNPNYTVEVFARNVAAHLLDAGFADQHLHEVVKAHIQSDDTLTLSELCEHLQEKLTNQPRREFDVLLAFSSVPRFKGDVPEHWLKSAQIQEWLTQNGFDTAGVRSPVATIIKVQARDEVGAAQAAKDEYDRFSARAILSTGKPLKAVKTLWVKGAREPSYMNDISRGVSVKELFREDRVFSTEATQSVDAALELLAHLEASSAPAAVAGGWAAIEGLLADPSDRASAADNFATLVTCSFPRAELTLLAHRLSEDHAEVRAALEPATTNRERARLLASMLLENRVPEIKRLGDRAAASRIKKLLGNPSLELTTVRDAISDSFHRLYRQRNLILHGGRLDSVALAASLRTAAKLAGAGMDRITHGHYLQGLKPLELVAKANLSLGVVSADDPLALVELLEPA